MIKDDNVEETKGRKKAEGTCENNGDCSSCSGCGAPEITGKNVGKICVADGYIIYVSFETYDLIKQILKEYYED